VKVLKIGTSTIHSSTGLCSGSSVHAYLHIYVLCISNSYITTLLSDFLYVAVFFTALYFDKKLSVPA
jgi:hypothetical protein